MIRFYLLFIIALDEAPIFLFYLPLHFDYSLALALIIGAWLFAFGVEYLLYELKEPYLGNLTGTRRRRKRMKKPVQALQVDSVCIKMNQ